MRLKDKVIIVTGSTQGIGESIARRCVAEGARVVIHGRDERRAQKLVGELGKDQDTAVQRCGDLADSRFIPTLVETAVFAFGKLDAVVNNAAITDRSDIDKTSPAFFDRMMAVNVRAPLMLIKAALPHLRKTGGCVVNIGAGSAYTGGSDLLDYSISKGALMTLSRNLANALGPMGVRVNHINPGWVLTENEDRIQRSEGQPPAWHDNLPTSQVPFGRMNKPEDIAAAVAFWLADDSRPFSGTVLDLEQFPLIGRFPPRQSK